MKLLVARSDSSDRLSFSRFRSEAGAAGKLTVGGEIPPEVTGSLAASIEEMLMTARREGCEAVAVIATEVFRAARNGAAVIRDLERAIGRPIALLTQTNEALLLRHGVARLYNGSFFLIDVGGGSVQAAWGDGESQCRSFPTGTFRLERDFQSSNPPRPLEYVAMREWIELQARMALPTEIRENTLVLGSNCMEEFLRSALAASNGDHMTRTGDGWFVTSLGRVASLLLEIGGRPYDTLGHYYPANPLFMRGADKALLNVVVIGSIIGAVNVVPTDESLGTSIARLLLDRVPTLQRYGIVWRPA